jgi:hypothetical protein
MERFPASPPAVHKAHVWTSFAPLQNAAASPLSGKVHIVAERKLFGFGERQIYDW